MSDLEKEHKRIVSQYDKNKSQHLEKQADRMLKDDQENEKLRQYKMKTDFFDLFN